MSQQSRYERALIRNLYEIRSALSERNAINSLVRVAPRTRWSFFTHSYLSLYNDMFSHAMKVFDLHKDAASFWYLYRCEPQDINEFIEKSGIHLDELEKFSRKLKDIRDKTHFHIDKKAVFDPTAIWKKAGITGDDFNRVVEFIWELLNHLHRKFFNRSFKQPIYEAEDVKAVVESAKKAGLTI